ncbi:MAG: hypothetical protein K8I27_13435 [Planctomycetes bacterium]|nr:hypothetical protein [Planctomycetota bacterium]
MTLRGLLLVLIAGLGAFLHAQGMSDNYVEKRAEEKFSKPHGFSLDWDLYAHVGFFEQQQRVRSAGIGSDRISFTDDLDGAPIGVTGGTDLRLRFSWHDSIQISFNPYFWRAFKDDLDDFKRWNGIIYPPNTDIDYAADLYEFSVLYRRDLFRLGLSKSFTFFAKAGLEYAYIRTQVGSDTFTVDDDRDVEVFRELLPWYSVGLGAEIEIGQSIRLTAEARGTYFAGFPTFQERDSSDMKQSVTSLHGIFTFEWNITDWFALVARARFHYLKVRLYGGFRQDNFLFYTYGPDIGFGLRF